MNQASNTLQRSPKIFVGRLGAVMGPSVAAEICTILSVMADSVVGQHFVDSTMAAATALLVSFSGSDSNRQRVLPRFLVRQLFFTH